MDQLWLWFRTPFPFPILEVCILSISLSKSPLNNKAHILIMAARFLDMALDDVAKSRSKDTRGPGNRRGGATRGGNSGRDSPARNNRSSPYSVRNLHERTCNLSAQDINADVILIIYLHCCNVIAQLS